MIVGLNSAGLSAVGTTLASYSDAEEGIGNFSAGVFDLAASPGEFSKEIISAPVIQHIGIDHSFSTVSGKYKMTLEENGAEGHELCVALTAELTDAGGGVLYSGALLDLFLATTTMSADPSETYDLKIATSSPLGNELNAKTCSFNMHISAWQTDAENASAGGFSDSEIISGEITAHTLATGSVVLNEFLPNPKGDDWANMPAGEWVELYNTGDEPVDVTGWFIRDDLDDSDHRIMIDTAHTGKASQIIGAKKWLVVYLNKALLNNSGGDSVRLFDSGGTLIDSYTYTLPADFCKLEPTPGETNDEAGNGVGDGCTGTVKEDKSYARIPDGTGAWVDPIPTPGEPNVAEEEMIVASPAPETPGAEEEETAPAEEETATENSKEQEGDAIVNENGDVLILINETDEEAPVSEEVTAEEQTPEDAGEEEISEEVASETPSEAIIAVTEPAIPPQTLEEIVEEVVAESEADEAAIQEQEEESVQNDPPEETPAVVEEKPAEAVSETVTE